MELLVLIERLGGLLRLAFVITVVASLDFCYRRARHVWPEWQHIACGGFAMSLVLLALGVSRLLFATMHLDPPPPTPAVQGPLIIAAIGAAVFAIGWALSIARLALSWQAERRQLVTRRQIAGSILALVAVLAAVAPFAYDVFLTWRVGDPSTPPQALRELYAHPWVRNDSGALRALARNPATPPDLLRDLARRGVASAEGNARADRDAIAQGRWYILRLIARHKNTPEDALALLADPAANRRLDWLLRELLDNDRLPAEVRWQLARHDSPWVRRFVAMHPSTPAEIRAALRQDADPDVREAAPPE